jgi:protein translocase SEC61 complex gamma subunit
MKLSEFLTQSIRVIKISYKPSKEEFLELAKFCGIAILILGLSGYIIYVLVGG